MLPIYPGKSVSNFNLPFLLSLWQMLSLNSPKKLLGGLQTQIKHTVGKVLRQTLTLRPSQVPLPWKSQLTSLSPFPLFPLTLQPAPFSVVSPPGPWNLLPRSPAGLYRQIPHYLLLLDLSVTGAPQTTILSSKRFFSSLGSHIPSCFVSFLTSWPLLLPPELCPWILSRFFTFSPALTTFRSMTYTVIRTSTIP